MHFSAHTSGTPDAAIAARSIGNSEEAGMDRRSAARVDDIGLQSVYRLQGKLRRFKVPVIDFNRFGLALATSSPLPLNHYVYLWLDHASLSPFRVVGVVHNCVSQNVGYRCGVRFRTDSHWQQNPNRIVRELKALEMVLGQR